MFKVRVTQFFLVFILVFIGTLTLLNFPAKSGVNCSQVSHWSSTRPAVNQTHIFCGEWNSQKQRPSGFHSRPKGQNPNTVAKFTMTQSPNSQGIYGGRWNYIGQSKDKFSTMFPDNCTQTQVINSIVYAATHPSSCPANAPSWASCGFNQPQSSTGNYCKALNKAKFLIAFAPLGDNKNKINTAFPLRN